MRELFPCFVSSGSAGRAELTDRTNEAECLGAAAERKDSISIISFREWRIEKMHNIYHTNIYVYVNDHMINRDRWMGRYDTDI